LSLYWLQQQLRETFHGATTKIEEKTRPHSSFSVDVGGFLQWIPEGLQLLWQAQPNYSLEISEIISNTDDLR
jgi:hypothetical protein